MSGDNSDDLLQKLKNEGWYLSPQGIDLVSNNGTLKDIKRIIQNSLDHDLKEIGKSILGEKLTSKHLENIVLQIQKIKIVSAPKANEDSQAAPRMLKFSLTDGHTNCQAIELSPILSLNLNKTAPGTKVLLKTASIVNGFIFLKANNVVVLGGHVAALYEKWEVNKNNSNFKRGSSDSDGPPPWVNFGKKIASEFQKDFKSLEDKQTKDEVKQSEFDVQRNVAIAEATSGAVKKVFGGGIKPLASEKFERKPLQQTPRERNAQPRGKQRKEREKSEPILQQKPSEKVSLFSYLEDKLPVKSGESKYEPEFTQKTINNVDYNKQSYNNDSSNNYAKYGQSNRYQKQQPQYQQHIDNLSGNMERMNLNGPFASKAFKQHLNLPQQQAPNQKAVNDDFGGPKSYNRNQWSRPNNSANDFVSSKTPRNEPNKRDNTYQTNQYEWKVGDLCMAKYWEDNKYYNAVVTGLTERTCVVKYNDYGNMEEVLKLDCIPVSTEETRPQQKYFNGNDFRHTGNRNFVNRNYRRQQH